jgi:aspartate carbamoyltransferase catalytic subunit
VLDLDDFSGEELVRLLDSTAAMKEVLSRDIKKVPTLRGKSIVLLFYEPSTRTRVSFEQAGKILSADVVTVAAAGSSVVKGESLIDTGLTLQAMGVDAIIMRHSSSGAPYLLARRLDVSIINAGDGWHAHPTQALLDLYTIREKLGLVEGCKVVIVGDILHSRVARSNVWGLMAMGARVVLCGPPTLLPADFAKLYNGRHEGAVQVTYDLNEAVEDADVVMALRLQVERQQAGLLPSLREYSQRYQVNEKRLARARGHVLVMHPGPTNEGVELSSEIAHSNVSAIQEQVTNGVALRMALLLELLSGPRRGGNE